MFKLEKIHTNENVIDMMTKFIARKLFAGLASIDSI